MCDDEPEDALSDNEIYFLTPVNAYKISDKIQSANNMLFASSITEQEPLQVSTMSSITMNEMKLQSQHRVTFSSDIEEYEDDEAIVTADEMDNSCRENEEEIEEIVDSLEPDKHHQSSEYVESDADRYDSSDNETIIIARHELENTSQPLDGVQIDIKCDEISSRSMNVSDEGKSKTTNASNEKSTNDIKKSSKTTITIKSDSKMCTKQQQQQQQQHQFLKIHLNVRKCCEFRYLENDRLPRYNGYISQYGLSKDQLDDLESNKRFNRQQMNEKRKQYREAYAKKSEENEQAFAKWLHHKQKTAKSRTKNMYDS